MPTPNGRGLSTIFFCWSFNPRTEASGQRLYWELLDCYGADADGQPVTRPPDPEASDPEAAWEDWLRQQLPEDPANPGEIDYTDTPNRLVVVWEMATGVSVRAFNWPEPPLPWLKANFLDSDLAHGLGDLGTVPFRLLEHGDEVLYGSSAKAAAVLAAWFAAGGLLEEQYHYDPQFWQHTVT